MGSLGWSPCYWCGWWGENVYIPDGMPDALCGDCVKWLANGGGPYHPAATDRREKHIMLLYTKYNLPDEAYKNIASTPFGSWEP